MDEPVTGRLTRKGLLRAVVAFGVAAPFIPRARGANATGADVEKAKQEGLVSLYMSLDPTIADAIIKPFTAKYGIRVQYYRASSPAVTAKVLQEADANRVGADVVDASDVGGFLVMKQRGVLLPYDSPVAQSVPVGLKDPDGTWVADRLTQYVIQYNTKSVTGAAVPHHWIDLAAPRFANQLVYLGDSAGDGAPALYRMAKEFGWDLLEKYAVNKPIRVDGPQLETQIIEHGERIAGFNQNDNLAWRSKRQGEPTDYVYPSEGVFVEPGAVGILKGAAHPNAAKLFYDWWLGDIGQKVLVQGGKYSSRQDLGPPEGNPPLGKLKLLKLDYAEWTTQRTHALQRLTQIFGGDWGV